MFDILVEPGKHGNHQANGTNGREAQYAPGWRRHASVRARWVPCLVACLVGLCVDLTFFVRHTGAERDLRWD